MYTRTVIFSKKKNKIATVVVHSLEALILYEIIFDWYIYVKFVKHNSARRKIS